MSQRGIVTSLLGFIVVLLLTACNSWEQAENSENIHTTIVGGRVGGSWSIFTEGIAESIRREHNGAIITVEPGGLVENPLTVATNRVPYGVSYSMTAFAAYSGKEPYREAYDSIRAVSVIIPANYYQFIVRADVDFTSLDEIAEKQIPIRLAVDEKGSAGEIITRNIFKEYGLTYDDIISWGGSIDHLGDSQTFELMADKRIDATGDAISVPSGSVIEATATNDLNILGLNPEIIRSVSENLGMKAGTIEAGSYDFLGEDINSVYTPAILITNKDVPEEEVYLITKAIYENLEYLGTVHKEFEELTLHGMVDVGNVPLHPGAEKFFKEKGLME